MLEKELPKEILEDNEYVILPYRIGCLTYGLLVFWLIIIPFVAIGAIIQLNINIKLISQESFYLIISLIIWLYLFFETFEIKNSGIWLTNKFIIILKRNKFHKIKYEDIRTFEWRRLTCRRWDEILEIETIENKKFKFSDINAEELYEKFREKSPNYIPHEWN